MSKRTKEDRRRPLSERVLSIRVGELAGEIDARCREEEDSAAFIVKRDVTRYYRLIREELATIDLSQAEASLVCDACNGLYFDDVTSTHNVIWAEVADSIRLEHLDVKWKVDGAKLVKRLQEMTPGQRIALADAVQRFWVDDERGTREGLLDVGLIRERRKGLEPT